MGKLHKSLGIKKGAALSSCDNKPESEPFLETSKKRISLPFQSNVVKTGGHWLTETAISFQNFYTFEIDYEIINAGARKGLNHFFLSTCRKCLSFFHFFLLFLFFFFFSCLLSWLLVSFLPLLPLFSLLSFQSIGWVLNTNPKEFFVFCECSLQNICWLVSRTFCWLQSEVGIMHVNIILKESCLLSREV